jgi:hypothetical protein
VKEGREEDPGMISRAWVADRLRARGEDSVMYQSRVLARFPADADDRLVPLSWLDIAHQRAEELEELFDTGEENLEKSWLGDIDLGLDVARLGEDSTCMPIAYPQGIRSVEHFRKAPTTDTAAWAVGIFRQLRASTMRVDATGLGAGVYDMAAQELGAQVIEMVPGSAALDPVRYINARAEWGWNLRQLCDPKREGGSIGIVRDERLALQLAEYKWKQDKKGRIQLEPKEDLKRRIRMSPDEADASMYALAKVNWNAPVAVDADLGYRENPWKV